MVYKIFYTLCLLCVTLTNIAAHRTGQQRPFFYFKTEEPNFCGFDEITLGSRESLIYAFHAEHEDTALFLKERLTNYITARLKQPVAIRQELCAIMQRLVRSFLQKQEDPFNPELQKVIITFFHPHRNNISVHHIACDQGTFKELDTIEYNNIIKDPKRLFISMLIHKDMPNDPLLAELDHIENNALTRKVSAKYPHKLLNKLLLKDNNIKGLLALSGHSWLKKTHPTFATQEYQQLAKKYNDKQLGKNYQLLTPIETSILTHAQSPRKQLLQFAAQLRVNDREPTPQFALDFLDDIIQEKREQEKQEQQTNRFLSFINVVPSVT